MKGLLCVAAALFVGSSQAMSMRNVNGECMASFCWNGMQVDPFDCWCPDPDSTVDSGAASSGGGTQTTSKNPECKQKKCWDDSSPNFVDCSCPPRPEKPGRDHSSPYSTSSNEERVRPIEIEFNVKVMSKSVAPIVQYAILILMTFYYQTYLNRYPEFVQNLVGEDPLGWSYARLFNRYWWLSLIAALGL